VDTAIQTVQAKGGKLAIPKMAVPGIGYIAYCQDTEGNLFGMLQADANAK
jgi:predicted enzyme related to lactoylglutathione lyase